MPRVPGGEMGTDGRFWRKLGKFLSDLVNCETPQRAYTTTSKCGHISAKRIPVPKLTGRILSPKV